MKPHNHVIVGIHITNRVKRAGAIQKLLTEYGAHIKTRVGLHEVEGNQAAHGIILLEMVGNERQGLTLLKKLNAIPGVEAKKLVFSHD
jgi:hypothetical protein